MPATTCAPSPDLYCFHWVIVSSPFCFQEVQKGGESVECLEGGVWNQGTEGEAELTWNSYEAASPLGFGGE
jgi:hypothetical protein